MECDKVDKNEQLVQIPSCVVSTDEYIPSKIHDHNFQVIQMTCHSYVDNLNKYHIPVLATLKTNTMVSDMENNIQHLLLLRNGETVDSLPSADVGRSCHTGAKHFFHNVDTPSHVNSDTCLHTDKHCLHDTCIK